MEPGSLLNRHRPQALQSGAVSVVVCTYNRSDSLIRALESLCRQRTAASAYEVIVVDNNSSDDTRSVVDSFRRLHPNVVYRFEPGQGLSHARNRGWREARGDYVAFVDDDCEVPEQWLECARGIIGGHAPVLFGGPFYAAYRSPKPCWWKERYDIDFSRRHRPVAGRLPPGTYLDGGNLFIRRAVLRDVGGFDPGLGMSGRNLGYGEDTMVQMRIEGAMPSERPYYAPELYVHHLVRGEKMKLGACSPRPAGVLGQPRLG